MALTPNFNQASIEAEFRRRMKAIDNAVVTKLKYLGEQCVIQARSLNTYRDQTGNLRSSVGYVVVKNGAIVAQNFAGSNAAGETTGQSLASRLAGEVGRGWALIVVAGMNYAMSVESRGLDVLTSAEQLAKAQLPQLLADLKTQTAR